MNTKVYLKFFNTPGEPKEVTTKDFSKWFPNPMRKAFKKVYKEHIYEDDYVLGPLYKANDFQFGATGTLERNESYLNCIARELGEEIGIVPNSLPKYPDALEQLNEIGNYKFKKSGKMKVYRLYIKDARPVASFENKADLSKSKDIKKYKAGCFVYGKKTDILGFLSQPIYHYKSPDDIVGVVAVKAKDAYEHYY